MPLKKKPKRKKLRRKRRGPRFEISILDTKDGVEYIYAVEDLMISASAASPILDSAVMDTSKAGGRISTLRIDGRN